jgi:RNA polymerase sigma-70 factor (ECF subfamily)
MAHNSPDIPEPTIKTSVLSLVNIYYKVPYQTYTRNMIIKEDEEIILECLSGNTDSYKYLVEKYQFRIINTCYKYTKNIVDAEDVAQEVFLKAYQNLSTFKSNSKFYSWLYRIAVNTSLNYINSKEKRNEKETISEENCLIDMNISKDNPRDYYQLNELINTLQPLMDNLPDDLRTLIELYEIKDFTYDEISKKLSIPIGTVRSRLHRARNMLISDFKRINDEE